MKPKRLLIVGGVAGGASCAARARRLSEKAQIVIFERGPYVSFANCGLPYHVGNVIQKEDDLLVATPELFRDRFKIDVKTEHHVRRILPERKEIEIESLKSGRIYPERYDALVLSPGPHLKSVAKAVGADVPVGVEKHCKISFSDARGVIGRDAPLIIWNDPVDLTWSAEEREMLAESDETRWLTETMPA